MDEHRRVHLECPMCGKAYHVMRNVWLRGESAFCSKDCGWEAVTFKQKQIFFSACRICGDPVTRTEGHFKRVKSGVKTCSRECYFQAVRLKLIPRKQSAPPVAFSRTVSKLEDRVADELTRLGVPFIRQYEVRLSGGRLAVLLDFYLTDVDLALEVNGKYWHADPRKYPPGSLLTQRQRERVAKDEYKREILCKRGIPLVELWEIDLEEDFQAAVASIAHAYGRPVITRY